MWYGLDGLFYICKFFKYVLDMKVIIMVYNYVKVKIIYES